MSETVGYTLVKEGRIAVFLRWWGRELLALLPPRFALFLGLVHAYILLAQEDGNYSVYRLLGGTSSKIGPLPSAETVQRLKRYRASGAEFILRIPPSMGLRRTASIAVSALPRGFDAVAGEIERQTPFAPDQVYLGYRVDKTVDSRGRVLAHLSLAPCASVDAMLRALSDSGVVPDRVTLGEEASDNAPGDTVHILTARPAGGVPKFWLGCTAILFLVALVSPFLRQAMTLSKIENALVQARQASLSANGQKDAVADARSNINWLAEWRGQRPPVTALLNSLSAALPDTAYLAQFELTGRILALQGVASAAPELIAPLEALPEVARVEFSAPTLRDPVTGQEQFQLTIELHPAAAPDRAQ
jgi:general secretion pathway protein L